MKRTLFLLGLLSLQAQAQSQSTSSSTTTQSTQTPSPYKGRVGINTELPSATLEIHKPSGVDVTVPQGVLFPKFTTAERKEFRGVVEGTMIYNTTKKCLEIYKGEFNGIAQWSCCCSSSNGGVDDGDFAEYVALTSSGFTGSYIAGAELTDAHTVSFTIKNNSISSLKGLDLSNSVVLTNERGNIAVKPNQHKSVDIAPGETKKITFILSGTLGIAGNNALTAIFNYKGITESQSTNVKQGISGNFVSQTRHEVSLNYKNIPVQGKLTSRSRQFRVEIPYTGATVGAEYDAVRVTKATATGQNNDINNLTLSIPAGRIASTNGVITATITIDGDGEYLIRQLNPNIKNDVNGLYNEYTIVDFPVNLSGARFNVTLKGISGVPDRLFGVQTNGQLEHQFVYVPVKDKTGKVWMNHNLGAEYTRVDSPDFDPLKERTDNNIIGILPGKDYKAFGSLFQWQRKADGHELGTWTGEGTRSFKYPTSNDYATSWTNTDNRFRKPKYNWVADTVYNEGLFELWRVQGSNNPCPEGYYVPGQEFHKIQYDWTKSNNTDLVINITIIGGITTSHDDGISTTYGSAAWSSRKSEFGRYASTIISVGQKSTFLVDDGRNGGSYPVEGRAIRCVKN